MKQGNCHAGADSSSAGAAERAGDNNRVRSMGGLLHALIKQRTAALDVCDDTSSTGTGWED